jgi:hypothetical protein
MKEANMNIIDIPDITGINRISLSFFRSPHDALIRANELSSLSIALAAIDSKIFYCCAEV